MIGTNMEELKQYLKSNREIKDRNQRQIRTQLIASANIQSHPV